jgi:octopine/nopaline transport system permease protein
MDWAHIAEILPRLLEGAGTTLELVIVSLAIGFVLATGLVLARLSANRALSGFARGYIFVFRGTPLLVQIFLIYFGLGQFRGFWEAIGLWGVLREAFWCAILALALNTAAYTAEILRGGIQSIPYGQIEAARACGMSRLLMLRRIVAPIALRQALPAYGNEVILMVKATSLASIITILEITGIAKQINARTFAPFEVFTAAGILYLAINFGAAQLIRWLEWRTTPHLRPRT